jgi:hypothetical protein
VNPNHFQTVNIIIGNGLKFVNRTIIRGCDCIKTVEEIVELLTREYNTRLGLEFRIELVELTSISRIKDILGIINI